MARLGTVSRLVAALAAGSLLVACGSDGSAQPELSAIDAAEPATFEYLIPLGSGERIDAGEELELFPDEFTAAVGDSIKIVNEDDRGHTVGPFFVGAFPIAAE